VISHLSPLFVAAVFGNGDTNTVTWWKASCCGAKMKNEK